MKKAQAAMIAVLLPCAAYAAVIALTERVSLNTGVPAGRERRVAIAIRDDVTPFQKWGTRQFTSPYLNRYYERAWYFTQSETGDGKQAFLSCLESALERYPEVDLFLQDRN